MNAIHTPTAFAPIAPEWCVQHHEGGDTRTDMQGYGAYAGNVDAFESVQPIARVTPHAA